MIQCPKCGAMNPEGFRNCKECYHPFGLEQVLREVGPAPGLSPYPAQAPGGPPMGGYPAGARPAQAPPARCARRVPVVVWVSLVVLVVFAIFAVAWFLTHGSSGSSSYLESVFANMDGLTGWEAEVRVDSSEYPMDALSLYLGSSWKGTLVFQAPDRFSVMADSLQTRYSYGLRIIEGTLYEWDGDSGTWRNMGPAPEEYLATNPVWDTAFTDELLLREESGLQDVGGRMCRVLTFDKDVRVSEGSAFGEFEMVYHYQGSIYVDSATDLVACIDYIVEIPDIGRSHYRYDFHSLGAFTSVEVPPGALAPPGGG